MTLSAMTTLFASRLSELLTKRIPPSTSTGFFAAQTEAAASVTTFPVTVRPSSPAAVCPDAG